MVSRAAPRIWNQLYSFTTENIAAYLPALGKIGPRVLTVCGSGDHTINAALLGASEITAFDINPDAAFWLELKAAALQKLEYQEFLRFFLREELDSSGMNRAALNYETYGMLRPALSEKARTFFDFHYRKAEGVGTVLRNSALFNNRHDYNWLKISSNLYLRDVHTYREARRRLGRTRLEFLRCCVTKLRELINRKRYQTALLSNIADYAGSLFPGDAPLCAYINRAVSPLLPALVRGGVFAAAYLYDVKSNPAPAELHGPIDCPERRRKAFSTMNAKEIEFSGVRAGTKDLVVLVESDGGSCL